MQKGATIKTEALIMLEEAGDIKMLNSKQCQVFDRMMDYFLSGNTSQLLFYIDGVADTGKSTWINIILWYMIYHAAQSAGSTAKFHDPVIWTALTSIAAYNIQGCTLHLLVRLPINQLFVELSNGSLRKLQ